MIINNATSVQAATKSDANNQINVMVVDDSAVIRGLFSGVLESTPNINIITAANNGRVAITQLEKYKDDIDVITLDIEMPEMSGLEALPKLLKIAPDVKIIMASSLSGKGTKETMEALSKGAADYLCKPTDRTDRQAVRDFTEELVNKVKILGAASNRSTSCPSIQRSKLNKPIKTDNSFSLRKNIAPKKPYILAIASSTGGPQALTEIFKALKNHKISVPIVITQHMPAEFTTLLAKQLSSVSGLIVQEGVDGEEVKNGVVYLAPGGYHLLIADDNGRKIIRITEDPAENFCRPAADPMLRSVVENYGGNVLLMVLTGMGADGCKGAEHIVNAGGNVIAQDEESSVVWGMPGAVAMAGLCSEVLPLTQLPQKFINLSQGQII